MTTKYKFQCTTDDTGWSIVPSTDDSVESETTTVELTTNGSERWTRVAESFLDFLRAVGFVFPDNMKLDLVEDTTVYALNPEYKHFVVMEDVFDLNVEIDDNVFDADGNVAENDVWEEREDVDVWPFDLNTTDYSEVDTEE